MSDQPQRLGSTGEVLGKARDHAQDYARDNPDQARTLIDKVEDLVDGRTGGRFSAAVEGAGDWVERQLDLPTDPAPPGPSDPGETVPAPGPAPQAPTRPSDPDGPDGPAGPVPSPPQG